MTSSENNAVSGRTCRPELLAPAGSRGALEAAVEAGADAVYLGLSAFGARAYAENFAPDALRDAVALAHAYGVRVYVTMNTLVTDRELDDWLRAAWSVGEAGGDALIVADLGAAALASRYLPGLRLHASTQLTGHGAPAARFLAERGFSRMVCARELPAPDVAALCAGSPIEIEQFVHGALCVSVSGQCLMSSLIGGRSGNRGECAQPCRLPYGGKYPLSLKDLSLAARLPEVLASGVASLKLEGRMKSPDYVYGVTRIYRRLLDEERGATADEQTELSALFSRGGFTDGYFTGRVGHGMLGVRGEDDKSKTAAAATFPGLTRKIPLTLTASICQGREAQLTLTAPDGRAAAARGGVPERARTAPLNRETVSRALGRFGGTPYRAAELSLTLDPDVMLPVSSLNALRRDALAALERAGAASEPKPLPEKAEIPAPAGGRASRRTAILRDAAQLTPAARAYFDRIFLPLSCFTQPADGVLLPPVIFPHEETAARTALAAAVAAGAARVMLQNPGQLALAAATGLPLHGSLRLNVTNGSSAALWLAAGLENVILSPELRAAQARDIGGQTAVVVYGRLPLMLTEKCVLRELSPCRPGGGHCPGRGELVDRRGAHFPVLPEAALCGKPSPADGNHRSEIFNSVPTYMSDREQELRRCRISDRVYLFTTESPAEVDALIDADRRGAPPSGPVRRLP